MSRIVTCKKCSLDKPHEAKGLCHSCYETERAKIALNSRLVKCKLCLIDKPHHAKGYCKTCYTKANYTLEHLNEKGKRYYRANTRKAIVRAQTRKKYNGIKKNCLHCGATERLEFDHIPDENGAYSIDHFRVLCKSCHNLVTRTKSILSNKTACGIGE